MVRTRWNSKMGVEAENEQEVQRVGYVRNLLSVSKEGTQNVRLMKNSKIESIIQHYTIKVERTRKCIQCIFYLEIFCDNYSRTTLILTMVIRIGLALRANLSRILQN
jgi:hypothetical protein